MSLQLARDTYRGIKPKIKRTKHRINASKYNDALALERGYTPERVARISESLEKPLSDPNYFTVLSSPIDDGEGVDMPIVFGMDCE